MTDNNVIKKQFNKGAQNFDAWSVTHNKKMLQGLCDFCELESDDTMLDVACGTGALSSFASKLVKSVTGIDLSESMIKIAFNNVKKANTRFVCHDVRSIPFGCDLFSIVVSKSAFHHMESSVKVFSEMVRCCKLGGRICIQDIMAYDNCKLDNYFENIEYLIDESHYKTYSKHEFFNLYKMSNLKINGIFETETLLNFSDYVKHVVPKDNNLDEIYKLLNQGMNDKDISLCFVKKGEKLFWKRKVITLIGQKLK